MSSRLHEGGAGAKNALDEVGEIGGVLVVRHFAGPDFDLGRLGQLGQPPRLKRPAEMGDGLGRVSRHGMTGGTPEFAVEGVVGDGVEQDRRLAVAAERIERDGAVEIVPAGAERVEREGSIEPANPSSARPRMVIR